MSRQICHDWRHLVSTKSLHCQLSGQMHPLPQWLNTSPSRWPNAPPARWLNTFPAAVIKCTPARWLNTSPAEYTPLRVWLNASHAAQWPNTHSAAQWPNTFSAAQCPNTLICGPVAKYIICCSVAKYTILRFSGQMHPLLLSSLPIIAYSTKKYHQDNSSLL